MKDNFEAAVTVYHTRSPRAANTTVGTGLEGRRSLYPSHFHFSHMSHMSIRSRYLMALLVVAAPAVSVAAQRTSATPIRIGVIDSRVLLQDMPGRAQAESQFALEMAKARELVHTATDSMRAAVDELGRAEADLRPQQRESAIMLMRARELALEDMVAQLNLLAGKRLEELQAPLLARLQEAVKVVRVRERLSLVVDLGAAAGVVDFDAQLSINSLVLDELRRTPSKIPPK